MKTLLVSRHFLGVVVALCLATLACSLSDRQPESFDPPPTSGPALPTQTTAPLLPTIAPDNTDNEPAPTPPPAEATPTATEISDPPTETPPPAQTDAPACTILQNIFVRAGPGQAYEKVGALTAGSTVTPVGYDPEGIPAGGWVLIEDTTNNQNGWITAGVDYVSCSLDLTTLPAVEVAAPPPPAPPRTAKSGNEGGNCGVDFAYDCEVIVSDDSFVQFRLLKKDGTEITQENGMENVSFIVRAGSDDAGTEVFSTVEGSAAYCIFGGSGPCNGWALSNGAYAWPNGTLVSGGEYYVRITATFTDEGSSDIVSWASGFTLTLP